MLSGKIWQFNYRGVHNYGICELSYEIYNKKTRTCLSSCFFYAYEEIPMHEKHYVLFKSVYCGAGCGCGGAKFAGFIKYSKVCGQVVIPDEPSSFGGTATMPGSWYGHVLTAV